jgi:hypothetical protein
MLFITGSLFGLVAFVPLTLEATDPALVLGCGVDDRTLRLTIAPEKIYGSPFWEWDPFQKRWGA